LLPSRNYFCPPHLISFVVSDLLQHWAIGESDLEWYLPVPPSPSIEFHSGWAEGGWQRERGEGEIRQLLSQKEKDRFRPEKFKKRAWGGGMRTEMWESQVNA
jgi:hypothetical protein